MLFELLKLNMEIKQPLRLMFPKSKRNILQGVKQISNFVLAPTFEWKVFKFDVGLDHGSVEFDYQIILLGNNGVDLNSGEVQLHKYLSIHIQIVLLSQIRMKGRFKCCRIYKNSHHGVSMFKLLISLIKVYQLFAEMSKDCLIKQDSISFSFVDSQIESVHIYAIIISFFYMLQEPEQLVHHLLLQNRKNCQTIQVYNDGAYGVVKKYHGQSIETLGMMKMIHDDRKAKSNQLDNSRTHTKLCKITNELSVTRPWISYGNMFQNDPSIFGGVRRQKTLRKITEIIFRGQLPYLYSYDNLFFNRDTEEFTFNPTSTRGLLSIIQQRGFEKEQLKQIYEILGPQMFQEAEDRRNLITYKSKFKAIAMFVIYVILHQRVTFLKKKDYQTNYISFQRANELVQMKAQRFKNFLKNQQVLQAIQTAEREDKVKYLVLLRKVFEKDCNNLEWAQFLSLLFDQHNPENANYASEKIELKGLLNTLSRTLFLIQPQNNKEELVRLGLALRIEREDKYSRIQADFKLITEEEYLHYLLQTASFAFSEIVGQILLQRYASFMNPITFSSIQTLINKCPALALTNPILQHVTKERKGKGYIQKYCQSSILTNFTQEQSKNAEDLLAASLFVNHEQNASQFLEDCLKQENTTNKQVFSQRLGRFFNEVIQY